MTDLITVEVYKHGSSDYDIPTRPHELMKFLQSKIDVIPAEFMESARIEIGLEHEFGEAYLGVVVTYRRPKTEQELAHDRKEDSVLRGIQEAADLRHLARLKAKYPQ